MIRHLFWLITGGRVNALCKHLGGSANSKENRMNNKQTSLTALACFGLLTSVTAAVASGFVESCAAQWYLSIRTPPWTPSASFYGPFWSFLYACIALAGWRVWSASGSSSKKTWFFYGSQLVLNALWPALFFYERNFAAAFFEIILLWGVILYTTVLFWRSDKGAAVLFLPYLLWITYATALTFIIWKMN
jgi:tryptophan-rich sensory protein